MNSQTAESRPLKRPMGNKGAVAWSSTAVLQWMRSRVAAAGGNPADVRDEPFHFLRITEVTRRTGLAKPTIYARIAAGHFPRPTLLA